MSKPCSAFICQKVKPNNSFPIAYFILHSTSIYWSNSIVDFSCFCLPIVPEKCGINNV